MGVGVGVGDSVGQLLWNWTRHFTVKKTMQKNGSFLSCLTQREKKTKAIGLDLQKTCVESVQKRKSIFQMRIATGRCSYVLYRKSVQ